MRLKDTIIIISNSNKSLPNISNIHSEPSVSFWFWNEKLNADFQLSSKLKRNDREVCISRAIFSEGKEARTQGPPSVGAFTNVKLKIFPNQNENIKIYVRSHCFLFT